MWVNEQIGRFEEGGFWGLYQRCIVQRLITHKRVRFMEPNQINKNGSEIYCYSDDGGDWHLDYYSVSRKKWFCHKVAKDGVKSLDLVRRRNGAQSLFSDDAQFVAELRGILRIDEMEVVEGFPVYCLAFCGVDDFSSALTAARGIVTWSSPVFEDSSLIRKLEDIRDKNPNDMQLFITGHSLGGMRAIKFLDKYGEDGSRFTVTACCIFDPLLCRTNPTVSQVAVRSKKLFGAYTTLSMCMLSGQPVVREINGYNNTQHFWIDVKEPGAIDDRTRHWMNGQTVGHESILSQALQSAVTQNAKIRAQDFFKAIQYASVTAGTVASGISTIQCILKKKWLAPCTLGNFAFAMDGLCVGSLVAADVKSLHGIESVIGRILSVYPLNDYTFQLYSNVDTFSHLYHETKAIVYRNMAPLSALFVGAGLRKYFGRDVVDIAANSSSEPCGGWCPSTVSPKAKMSKLRKNP